MNDEALFIKACRSLKLDPERLPEGITRDDILGQARAALKRTEMAVRDEDLLPWKQIHDLLLYGEDRLDPQTGMVIGVDYPRLEDVAQRFGTSTSVIRRYYKKHDIKKLRAELERREQELVLEHTASRRAADRIALHQKIVRAAHIYADKLIEGLTANPDEIVYKRADKVKELAQLVELSERLAGDDGYSDRRDAPSIAEGIERITERAAIRMRRGERQQIGVVGEDDIIIEAASETVTERVVDDDDDDDD
ncbi:MAG: hypothetical protein KKH12_16265 [Gammaproteobacteria bacterium]|nr:hypothetical protein [Gammaproteobacteria bacterium]